MPKNVRNVDRFLIDFAFRNGVQIQEKSSQNRFWRHLAAKMVPQKLPRPLLQQQQQEEEPSQPKQPTAESTAASGNADDEGASEERMRMRIHFFSSKMRANGEYGVQTRTYDTAWYAIP